MGMDPRTGAIGMFETEEDAVRAGHTVSLTKERAEELFGISREERLRLLSEKVDALTRTLEPRDDIHCRTCNRSPADGAMLERLSAKGEPEVWACEEHLEQGVAPADLTIVDPEG